MPEKIHIAFCSDGNNVPFLGVALKSVVDNSAEEISYIVYVIHDGMTCQEFCYLRLLARCRRNFELKFIDINKVEGSAKFKNLFASGHITLATYWRLLLPEILSDVNKLIYLDTDVVVVDDVAKLYSEDVSGYFCAGCIDIGVAKELPVSQDARKILCSLGYMDFSNYINAGVLLINLEYAREKNLFSEMLSLAENNNFPLHDQDVINYTLMNEGGAKIVDQRWSFAIHKDFEVWYPEPIVNAIKHKISIMDLAIIHYIGTEKPWKCSNRMLRELWVLYASKTPFFAEVKFSLESAVEREMAKSGKMRLGRKLEKLLIPKCIHRIKRNLLNNVNKVQ